MNIFEEVKEQLTITRVVEHYGFKVNRAKQFVCPFHNDHKPSASIKNDYFNCFVCGAGGDLITFTAKYLGLSNLEATKELIRVFHLNIQVDDKAERKQEQKIKEEVKKQNTLRDKILKDKELRENKKNKRLYSLRNEIKQKNDKIEEEQQQYIHYVGLLLADIHRYLWQGMHLYPYEHKRHIQGLQELTTCEYWLECFEKNPIEFCRECKGVIEKYEREFNQFDNENG